MALHFDFFILRYTFRGMEKYELFPGLLSKVNISALDQSDLEGKAACFKSNYAFNH